jgi:type VI secretion system protein ImpL
MLIKLLVAALVLLTVLFVALCWLVAVLMKITLWLPFGLTAVLVLSVVGVLVWRRVSAGRAARGLEKALAAQAKEQSRVVRPDLQLEVQRMQEEFDKAVDALKSSKLGASGRDALYLLPWYSIIGPPGAGKSTALRNSGLNFPYTSRGGAASVKGLGGTRNCDWWLTNEAVVLDTAGRWATQDEDHDEWLSFLGMLNKYRPKKPLNGLITAISVGDVVTAHEDEVEALALRMRERLDEVQAHLRVSVPVYVLFTKCDLVEGFLETFGGLKRTERAEVWGFTAPLAQPMGDPAAYFGERFDELADVLEKRSLARMADDERSLDRRAKIYAFPQQFAVLRRNLSRFVSVMFQANVFQQTPTLRGVYFTSGTQEGRPFNLLMNRLAESMGIRRKVEPVEAVVDQKSYFLHDVFMNVIFQDRGVASASEAELKRQRLRRLLLTVVLGACSLTFGAVPSYAWSLNKLALLHLESAVDEWEAAPQKKWDDKRKLEHLEPLRTQVNSLIGYEKNGPPLRMRMGMYQAGELVAPMRRYYANLLRRELVQPLVARDVEAMTDFGFHYASLPRAQPTEPEHELVYDVLRLHLLLTQPKSNGEPAFDATQQDWVRERLIARLSRAAGKDPALVEAAKTNADLYVGFMREFPDLAFPRDKEVVQRAREALNRVPATARALARLIGLAEPEGLGLTLERLVGMNGALRSEGQVRGAFTRRGFENVVRDRLTPEILDDAGELWVLGLANGSDAVKEQRAVQLEQLRTAYFRGYIDEWQNFLRGVRVEPAADHTAALALLRELSRGTPPPVSLLLQKVAFNVQLKPKVSAESLAQKVAEGTVDKLKNKLQGMLGAEQGDKAGKQLAQHLTPGRALGSLSEPDVGKVFEGFYSFAVPPDSGEEGGPRAAVPFDVYQEQLAFVRDALQTYLDDPAQSEQLQKRLQDARVRVRAIIDQQQVGWRPLFEGLLWPPIENAASSSSMAIASSAATSWCNDVVVAYETTLLGRYPMNRDGQDLALTDFKNFYQPKDGRVWKFLDAVLAKTLVLDGDHYGFSQKLGQDASAVYLSSLLEFLNRSHDITVSFYPTAATEPNIEFELKVQPSPEVASTQFSVGGQMVEHYNGPEKWKALSWPGQNPQAGASIVIRGANGMHERISQDGPWGLFRLLEAGTLMPGAGRTFTVAWRLETHDVTLQVDFRPKRGESPFFGVPGHSDQPLFLQPVRAKGTAAPRQILRAGKPCQPGK